MKEGVYKSVEITGSSGKGIEEAINNALKRSSETIRHMKWFKVEEIRGALEADTVSAWQVTLKIGFDIEGLEEERAKDIPEKAQKQGRDLKYRCTVCGYIYDPQKGDPTSAIKPGTPFSELPDDWKCPDCGVGKDKFEPL